jgi:epoxide hydrolase
VERDMRPFRIDIKQADLDDLLERLSRTCWPNEVPGVGWDYGASVDQVKDLLEYWPTG